MKEKSNPYSTKPARSRQSKSGSRTHYRSQEVNDDSDFNLNSLLANLTDADETELANMATQLDLALNMTGWNVFGLPNLGPELEVEYKSGSKIEPMDDIIREVNDEVILLVEEDIEGNLSNFTTVFDKVENDWFLFKNLSKFILTECDSDEWSVTFEFLVDGDRKEFVSLAAGEESTYSRKVAEAALIKATADLLFREGIKFPEESIQQRTFRFQWVLSTVPLVQYRMWKLQVSATKKQIKPLETVDQYFRELREELGGDFSSKDLNKIGRDRIPDYFVNILKALEHGERQWPFSNTRSK